MHAGGWQSTMATVVNGGSVRGKTSSVINTRDDTPNVSTNGIYSEMLLAYGDKCFMRPAIQYMFGEEVCS